MTGRQSTGASSPFGTGTSKHQDDLMKTTRAENMAIAGLDQDKAKALTFYSGLSPEERGEIAEWITGKGLLSDAPPQVLSAIAFFASIAFLETGLRWGQDQSTTTAKPEE